MNYIFKNIFNLMYILCEFEIINHPNVYHFSIPLNLAEFTLSQPELFPYFYYCTLHILPQAILKIKHNLITMTGLVFHIFLGVSYFLMLTRLQSVTKIMGKAIRTISCFYPLPPLNNVEKQ